jgi:hypothetical protein
MMRREKRRIETERRYFSDRERLREKRNKSSSPNTSLAATKAAGNVAESNVAAAKVSRVGVSHG